MQEIFKPIIGYEGLYEISNLGRVKSLSRKKINGKFTHTTKNKIMKNRKSGSGYLSVGLYKKRKATNFDIHRLVAKHFIANPNNKPQVNHKDGDKLNPNVDNLEWVTHRENAQHAIATGLSTAWQKGNIGKNTPASKRIIQIDKNGRRTEWDCMSDAVRAGEATDSGSLTRCCKGEFHQHNGSKWEYI